MLSPAAAAEFVPANLANLELDAPFDREVIEQILDELKALRQEVSDLRDEQRIASATIASGTAKTARILERVTPDGDAIATRVAA